MPWPKSFARKSAFVILAAAAFSAFSFPVGAKVRRIVIDKTKSESPALSGQSFGGAGQYEKLVGQAYGELDPNDPHNTIIQDIRFAPRNSRGLVEYVATFTLLKPIDMRK